MPEPSVRALARSISYLAERGGLPLASVAAAPAPAASVATASVATASVATASAPPTPAPPAPAAAPAARQRLAGLDGLRGLAAVYVVINHVFLRTFPGYPADHAPFWAGWLIYGRFAVVVFIVLSGFSLALSPGRHGWRLDTLSGFAQRRAWRILPAYWAALAFSLAVAWLIVPQPGNGVPDAKSVIVNGLLVQNLVEGAQPQRSVLVNGRRGPAVSPVPALAADRAPARRVRHGRDGHAGRGGGGGRSAHTSLASTPS